MYANIFGDFVKGKNLSRYPELIQKGILLHRSIDSYIDNHPAVIELLHLLYKPLPKIAGIAVDLYFDHLLAKKWESYHSLPLDTFIQNFELAEPEKLYYDNEFYWYVLSKMKEEKWLHHYQSMAGLAKACTALNHRISFTNALASAPEVFIEFEPSVKACFDIYMEDAKRYFSAYFIANEL